MSSPVEQRLAEQLAAWMRRYNEKCGPDEFKVIELTPEELISEAIDYCKEERE